MANKNRNLLVLLSELLAAIREWIMLILGFIAFITAVAEFIILWEGHTGLVIVLMLTASIGVGITVCGYVAFKRDPAQVAGSKQGPFRFSKAWRRWARAGLVIMPLLAVGWVSCYLYQWARPSSKVVILVAEFDGPEPQRYRVTETLLVRLRAALEPYKDVQVDTLNRAITEAEGSTAARSEGKKHNAAAVIWGWYGATDETVPLSVHFEMLSSDMAELRLQAQSQGQVQRMALARLEDFTLQIQLSDEMAFLSVVTVGLIRFSAQDWDGAIAGFTDALVQLESHAAIPDVYNYRGTAHAFKGEYDSAMVDYDYAIRLNPNSSKAHAQRGALCLITGEYERAIADFDRAIELEPSDAGSYAQRGFARAVRGEYDLAIADCNRADQLQNDDAKDCDDCDWVYYNACGLVHYYKGDHDRAIAIFDQAIRLQPEAALVYNNRGNAYADKGDYDHAIADHSRAIHLQPDMSITYVSRGNVYREKGDYDRAIADFNKAIQLQPDDALAYSSRAMAYRAKGDYDQAITDYGKALKLEPDSAEDYYNRGNAYADKGNYDQAIADYDQAIRLQLSCQVCVYYNRGHAYHEIGEYDRAIADYSKAIQLQPDDPNAYYNRGHAYCVGKGDYDKAIADFSRAIHLKPNYAIAYYARGMAHYHRGAIDQAIADFDQLIQLQPDNADAYISRGLSYSHQGDYDQAISDYDKAMRLEPDCNACLCYNRGLAYAQKGETEKAIADFKRVLRQSDDLTLRRQAEEQLQALGAR